MILEFEPTLAEGMGLVVVLAVVPLDDNADTAPSDVRTRKKSNVKAKPEAVELTRLVTVRVCCPLDSVGDL